MSVELHYNGRIFRGLTNSDTGQVSGETVFYYLQEGDLVSARYVGGPITSGQLLGTVSPDGSLDFLYHHVDQDGQLHAGRCHSTPTWNEDGVLVLEEEWQWLTGDQSRGHSRVIEVER